MIGSQRQQIPNDTKLGTLERWEEGDTCATTGVVVGVLDACGGGGPPTGVWNDGEGLLF